MDDFDIGGMERVLERLEEIGSVGLNRPAAVVRVSLAASRLESLPFDAAWSSAINRIQPSELFGEIDDATLAAQLREDRTLIEEDRVIFQAAYEGREATPRERAERVAATWKRLDLPPRPAARSRCRAVRRAA